MGTINRPQLPLADLEYIETFTNAKILARLRRKWDESKCEPIALFVGDTGRFLLRSGNHRLRLARERGDRTIAADIALPRRNRR